MTQLLRTTNRIDCNVAGTTFGRRQGYLAWLAKQDDPKFFLVREPGNPHDANAIKVMARIVACGTAKTVQAGYIPRDIAAYLAPVMDSGRFVSIESNTIVGGGRVSRGVRLSLSWWETMQ